MVILCICIITVVYIKYRYLKIYLNNDIYIFKWSRIHRRLLFWYRLILEIFPLFITMYYEIIVYKFSYKLNHHLSLNCNLIWTLNNCKYITTFKYCCKISLQISTLFVPVFDVVSRYGHPLIQTKTFCIIESQLRLPRKKKWHKESCP